MSGRPTNLLALAGLAPAVVSETAWALTRAGLQIPKVVIVTTAVSAPGARATLCGPGGAIARACSPATAPEVQVEVIRRHLDSGNTEELQDIQDAADHCALLQTLEGLVRSLTEGSSHDLHASIAGGRKTMAAALSLVMSLHARPQDQMSHVLAAPPHDSDTDFFFPPTGDAAAECAITLIEIPFPRLRSLLSSATMAHGLPGIMEVAQRQIDNLAPARLLLRTRTIELMDRRLSLPPMQSALLAMLAESSAAGRNGIGTGDLNLARLEILYRMCGAGPAAAALCRRLALGGADEWLREHLSRLRKCLLADPHAGAFMLDVQRFGARPHSRYRLTGRTLEVVEE